MAPKHLKTGAVLLTTVLTLLSLCTENKNVISVGSVATTTQTRFTPETISVAGCKDEGDVVDLNASQKCCAGSQALKVVKLGPGTSCSDEISGHVCAKCGDGICGKGENACNCPQDCSQGNSENAGTMTCAEACKYTGYEKYECNSYQLHRETKNGIEAYTGKTCKEGYRQASPWNRIKITDCNAYDEKTNSGKECCCAGEPENSLLCPKIEWPSAPTLCIEEPGWMKNPVTGECCWYAATCYGPDGWAQYKTKEECQNPCVMDTEKRACCRSGKCSGVSLDCGDNNRIDTEWMTCDEQCRPVAECRPKIDVWDSCDALCRKSNLGKATDCIADIGGSIVDPENGYGCCCEMTVCAKEGEYADSMKGQECCAGLEGISVASSAGIDELCIDPAHQKAGSICTFDDDCAPGLKCETLGAAAMQDMNSRCVNLSDQKNGAPCDFDDDCAPGFVCMRNTSAEMPDSTCAPKPACVKEGETIDGFNDQLECCAGLEPVDNIDDPLVGQPSDPGKWQICADCGDNICGKGENKYNCPDDCGSPPVTDITLGPGGISLTPGNCATPCPDGSNGAQSHAGVLLMSCSDGNFKQIICIGGSLNVINDTACCDDDSGSLQ